jgi:hypothetical protein
LSRLICSNNSTRDRILTDPHVDDTDTRHHNRGGANIRDDTPPTTSTAITTLPGPEFVTTTRPGGAMSGDHTQD